MKTTHWLVLELDPDADSLLSAAFACYPAASVSMVVPPFIPLTRLETMPDPPILLEAKRITWNRLDLPETPELIRLETAWTIPIPPEAWADYRRRVLGQLRSAMPMAADPIPLIPAVILALAHPGSDTHDIHSSQRLAPAHPVRIVQPRLSVLRITATDPEVRPWMANWSFHGGHRVSKAGPLPLK